MSKALVVLSGGQDSTTALFQVVHSGRYDEVHAITFDYGQRHRVEIQAACQVANLAGVGNEHEIIRLEHILKSTSPLLSGTALEQYKDAETMDKVIGDRVELTFVPMRNPFFLTVAANRAAAMLKQDGSHDDMVAVVTGVCQEDNANYPDCRVSFIAAMSDMIEKALGHSRVYITAPLIKTPKHVAIRQALALPGCYAALGYSHTAYDGAYPPTGRDHATVLRESSFEQANVPDPLVVRAWLEGALPHGYLVTRPVYLRHESLLALAREVYKNPPNNGFSSMYKALNFISTKLS